MTTAVVRPAHRRQTLDVTAMPPALLGGVTSTVTLDGRLLNDSQQRGRKEEDGRGPTRHQVKGAVARLPPFLRVSSEKAPMSPPRVSGVSLAPLPSLDCHSGFSGGVGGGGASGGEKSPGTSAPAKLQRKPSMGSYCPLGGKAPPPPGACGGTAACGTNGAAPAAAFGGGGCVSTVYGGANGPQQLIAEGRSIVRSVTLDPWVATYLDINGPDTDSICATPPPRITLQSLARADTHGAFGPLSPCPLSPSILTLCGQTGHDDKFAFNTSLELLDMRTCQSPKLPPV